ncbi:aldo/keto reductase [Micromonospora sp. WMMD961]|uniref:aldo/keto reductase n=1 Tax=Micromonospora sp. WMMD961 TaxID=3016100 RepID=UPI002416E279|nr:aldo/keto reductase [Micromonospora sp. WMMD961]MDG4781345.1 aldo/keto reductase [Micromonospora sp. WMMD961]
MRATNLGRSGVVVTELGLGTAQLGGLYEPTMDQRTANATVAAAWEAGIRYFDTAPHYGLGAAEERVGVALAGRPREAFTISTKVGRLIVENADGGRERRWGFGADAVRRSLDMSRQRLRLDRIDVALVHDPEEHLDQAIDEAFPALAELRAHGVIGAVGVGTRNLPSLLRFVRETEVDAVMVAGRLTLLDADALVELVPLCRERGVSVLNAGVFNSGVLAAPAPVAGAHFEYATAPPHVLARAREIEATTLRHGISLPEAALAFAAHSDVVSSVVVGADSPEQIVQTADAFAARHRDLSELWRDLRPGRPGATTAREPHHRGE